MSVTFSVIVPVYNCAECLPRALDSIQRQIYTNYEVLVINDGSTDRTSEVLSAYTRVPHFKLITLKENQGVASARNHGISLASGKFIAFLDSDDEWRDDYLQVMQQALTDFPEVILAYSHYQAYFSSTNSQEIRSFPNSEDLVAEMLVNNFIHTISSVVVPEAVFKRVGMFNCDLINCSDREFYLRAMQLGKPLVVPHVLVKKYWQQDSLTAVHNSQQWLENSLKLLDIFYSDENNQKYLPVKDKAERSLESRVRSFARYFNQDNTARARVSLIVTCYNRQQYLASTIESILNQTYPHFELLIWDDASTDNSLEIAKQYQQQDSRIRIVAQTVNQGFTKSIASAVAATKGEYIGWVDSDDMLHPFALANTVKTLDRNADVGMVYTNRLIIDEGDRNLGLDRRSKITYSPGNLLLNFMTFHFRLMRRDVYELAGGINNSFTTAQDYDLCLRLSEITNIEHIPEPLYFYRQHKGNISSQKKIEQIKCTQTAIDNALIRRKLAPGVKLKLDLKPKFSLVKQKCDFTSWEKLDVTHNRSLPPTNKERENLISLIVTIYNRENYLTSAIDSILAQTYTNFELILWDDGSTDNSLAIAYSYAERDSRIKVFNDFNRGQSEALIGAIAQASGQYLGTVDSDDLLHPEALSKTVTILQSDSNLGMVYTDHIVIDKEGKKRGLGKRCSIPYSPERLLIDFMTFHFRLIRREVYNQIGGFDASLNSAEDYDLCLRLSEVTEIYHLKEPLYYYRWHDNNFSIINRCAQTQCSAAAINRSLYRRELSQKLALNLKFNPRYRLVRDRPLANKVLGIGLSKTGTTSLNAALCLLGIPSVHFPPSIEQLENYDGGTDISVAIAYRELDRLYPGSKFILTIRKPQSWLRSFKEHRRKMLQKYGEDKIAPWIKNLAQKCYGQWEFDPVVYLATYQEHLYSVLEYFRERPGDLLILNICDGQGWHKLCDFLNCDIPNTPFPHSNQAKTIENTFYI